MMNTPFVAYFSPTGTSRAVARAIAEGLNAGKADEADVTFPHAPLPDFVSSDRLLVVAVPVYGGACAPLALQRLDRLKGNDTPAIAAVVYGNRDFGGAAVQLTDFLTERGFRVVGVGAFVGEHSYSTPSAPIAAGRPNADDLEEARRLGMEVRQKCTRRMDSSLSSLPAVDASALHCPPDRWWNKLRFIAFVLKYRRSQKKHPIKVLPITDAARCTSCGACAKACPVAAIHPDRPQETADTCIKCAACVKICPRQARTLPTPFAPVLAKNFHKNKPNVTHY